MSPAVAALALLASTLPASPHREPGSLVTSPVREGSPPLDERSVEEMLDSVLPFEPFRREKKPNKQGVDQFAEELGRRLNAKLKAEKKPVDGFKDWKGFLEPAALRLVPGADPEGAAPARELLANHPDPARRRAVFHYLDKPNFRIKRWHIQVKRYAHSKSGTEELTLLATPHLLEERSSWVAPYATTEEVWRRRPNETWELRAIKNVTGPVPYELF